MVFLVLCVEKSGLMAIQVSAARHGVNEGWWCLWLRSAGRPDCAAGIKEINSLQSGGDIIQSFLSLALTAIGVG
jgi:hypothetical protein